PQNTSPALRINEGHKLADFYSATTASCGVSVVQYCSAFYMFQPAGGSKHAQIGIVVDHIAENFKNELTLAQAAEMANLTEATFSRNFQTVTGHRFLDFVTRVRIGKACGLLYSTDDMIMSICHQAGFNTIANFNRHFLKMKGVTPTAYRETARRDLFPDVETMS
ncbi:MAG: helix-turn-helix transcriptional regulator, partial [Yoonia sp.]|nr:helix-turn-helix transcriptional regulator [Yoonia sp.]